MALVDRVCCVCGVVYGRKEVEGTTKPTHGYCDPCARAAFDEVDAYFASRDARLEAVGEVLHERQ